MTPRTVSDSPAVTNNSTDIPPEYPLSDEESSDEARPTHTSEIGTLKKLPNHNTAWLGSSSGVYFVNTVRRAFSAAFASTKEDTAVPASEDILTGDDVDGRSYNGPVLETQDVEDHVYRHLVGSLGRPPVDRSVAMELVTSFFRCWHPLFPFLHGPQFLKDMEDIYTSSKFSGYSSEKAKVSEGTKPWSHPTRSFTEHRKFITFQIIINIASLDRPDIQLPVESRIKTSWDVTQIAGCIAVRHDMDTIQACLAAELYLVATICLRQASTVAGIILKLIYHAGLHRCPLRYAQLSLEDCEIRKRIFWSAYALDRYLSLSLGDPNTVQDSDIDVCLSGKELHKAVARDLVLHPGDELQMHLPANAPGAITTDSPSEDPRVYNMNNGPQAREKQLREAAMTAYVHYGRLTGRIIEIFHKSIHARFPKQDAILYLNSDIESWWNGLPASLTGEESDAAGEGDAMHHQQLAPFFTILYYQLQLLLNRPRLSLDQSTAEFKNGLEVCIRASRNSLAALKKHKDNAQSMLLPGLLSAAWMAGLIIAFACQLGKYPKSRALSDISACLRLLESMGSQKWFTVKNCHRVLTLLLENINARKASANGFLAVISRNDSTSSASGNPQGSEPTAGARKRPLLPDDDTLSGPSPKKESSTMSEPSPSNSDFRLPLHPASNATTSSNRFLARENSDPTTTTNPHNMSMFDRNRRFSPPYLNNNNKAMSQDFPTDRTSSPSTFPYSATNQNSCSERLSSASMYNNSGNHQGRTSALSASIYPLKDFSQQNTSTLNPSPNNLHESGPSTAATSPNNMASGSGAAIPTNVSDDPMFWGNFDMNISDIFSAASWENMTGSGGPMNMNFNFGGFGANGPSAGLMPTFGTGTIGGGNDFGNDVMWNDFTFGMGGNLPPTSMERPSSTPSSAGLDGTRPRRTTATSRNRNSTHAPGPGPAAAPGSGTAS